MTKSPLSKRRFRGVDHNEIKKELSKKNDMKNQLKEFKLTSPTSPKPHDQEL